MANNLITHIIVDGLGIQNSATKNFSFNTKDIERSNILIFSTRYHPVAMAINLRNVHTLSKQFEAVLDPPPFQSTYPGKIHQILLDQVIPPNVVPVDAGSLCFPKFGWFPRRACCRGRPDDCHVFVEDRPVASIAIASSY